MEINAFYNTAKSYVDKIKLNCSSFVSDPSCALTIIMTDSQEIFSGITTVRVTEGNPEIVHSEESAVMEMTAANKTAATQLITVRFMDSAILKPCTDCLNKLVGIDPNNAMCSVVTGPMEAVMVGSLISDETSVSEELITGSGSSEASSLGAPAEFVSGFDFDESNPFLDAPSGSDEPVPELPQSPNIAPNNFNPQPNYGGGYIPQQGGYVQQQAYPQQGMYMQQQAAYPQQGGYVQQQAYPQQGGYVQQQAYPQQGGYMQQQSYPQQGYPMGQQANVYPGNSGMPNAMPMPQSPIRSVHTGGGASVTVSEQQSQYVSQALGGGGGVFKNRLKNYMGDQSSEPEKAPEPAAPVRNEPELSKSELLKIAKEQKKAAKMNAKNKY